MPDLPLHLPELRTGRYVLRAWRPSDRSILREVADDPDITAITTVPSPYTDAAADRHIALRAELLRTGIGYPFLIATADTDRPLGSIGVWMRDADRGRVDAGYWVAASARGSGAAAESLDRISQWAHDSLAIPRVELHVEPSNTASIRTAEYGGFQREGLLRSWQEIAGRRRDVYVYSNVAE